MCSLLLPWIVIPVKSPSSLFVWIFSFMFVFYLDTKVPPYNAWIVYFSLASWRLKEPLNIHSRLLVPRKFYRVIYMTMCPITHRHICIPKLTIPCASYMRIILLIVYPYTREYSVFFFPELWIDITVFSSLPKNIYTSWIILWLNYLSNMDLYSILTLPIIMALSTKINLSWHYLPKSITYIFTTQFLLIINIKRNICMCPYKTIKDPYNKFYPVLVTYSINILI